MNPPRVFQQAGANAVFASLNPSGSGSVSKSDFVQGMTGLMRSLRSAAADATSPVSTTSTSPARTLAGSLQSLNQIGQFTMTADNGLGGTMDALA